jgi:ketosteroid isomerase-like protein
MSRTLRAGALAGALVIGVVAGGSANLALARTPVMAPSQTTQPTSSPTSTDQVTAAIQQVIQRANAEQVKAIATGDASVMADTATTDHLAELEQNNQDMTDSGVTDIQLMRLEWGPISVKGDSAQATTYETWSVTADDGTTQVSRDTNVYTLVQDGRAWKIQSDEHPQNASTPGNGRGGASTSPNGSPSPSQSTPGFPGIPFPLVTIPGGGTGVTTPAPGQVPGTTRPSSPTQPTSPRPQVSPSQDTSHNWSGYAATNGKYTSVTGTWSIPQVSSNGAPGVGASWVGIGGVNSRDLIQAGTQETDGGSGRVQYGAWVETLPQVSEPVPFAVRPGDSVTVTIAEQSTNTWSIDFTNNTTGRTYHTTKRYTSTHSSAEWVVEAPSSGSGVLPLDNFGNVSFTNAAATQNGQTVNLSQAKAQPITMLGSGGQKLAVPTGIGSDGGSFSVSRTGSPATGIGVARGGSGSGVGVGSRPGSGFSTRPGVGAGSPFGIQPGLGSGYGSGSGSGRPAVAFP